MRTISCQRAKLDQHNEFEAAHKLLRYDDGGRDAVLGDGSELIIPQVRRPNHSFTGRTLALNLQLCFGLSCCQFPASKFPSPQERVFLLPMPYPFVSPARPSLGGPTPHRHAPSQSHPPPSPPNKARTYFLIDVTSRRTVPTD